MLPLKVLVPTVPSPERVLPRLQQAHLAKWWTNNGPLARELEARLAPIAGQGVCVSSATLGLELAYSAVFGLGSRRLVLVPAFTFPATVTALLRSGLEPVFCDGYELTPEVASAVIKKFPVIGGVVPVCTFGKAQRGWERFERPVVIDAAAALGNHLSEVTSVFSLHATKALPAIEGGYVAGPPEVLDEISKTRAFGLVDGEIEVTGTNAKLSEVHAAYGLEALADFDEQVARRIELEALYRVLLPADVQVPHREAGAYNTFPVFVPDAVEMQSRLSADGIETRRWYLPDCSKHPAFRSCVTIGNLTECARLERECLCLPFHLEMTDDDVIRVCKALKKHLPQALAA